MPDPAFLERLLDALPDLVFAKDLEGRYLHVNRAFAEAMGRSAESIIGQRDAELRPAPEAARERAIDESCLASRSPTVTPDTTRGLFRGPDDRPIGVAGTVRTPSDRPGNRTSGPAPAPTHSDSEDRPTDSLPPVTTPPAPHTDGTGLEALLDAMPVAIYAKNLDGTFSGANRAFARLMGASAPHEIIGRRDADFPWRPLDHSSLDEEVIHDELARHGIQRREVDRFARRRWTETSVVPQTDELGRVIGVVGIRLDVSAHHEEIAQVERARAASDRVSRSKSAFLTQMSHELRTPLTSLLGFAELALEPDTDPAVRLAHLERIRDNGWQVLALVDDLLDLSRIESGRLATRARVFAVRDVLEGLSATYGPRLRSAGLELHLEIDDAVPDAITSDPIRFQQILANLLERARSEAGQGQVTLRATVNGRAAETDLVIEVRDEGPSLTAEDLDARLHPLDHDASAEAGRGGLGLGLAIAWSLADLLEGRIDHSSGAGGRGTRFTLRVPVRSSTADTAVDWSPATREAHDPWQRVEAAARDGVAWFAPPPEDLDADEEPDAGLPGDPTSADDAPARGDAVPGTIAAEASASPAARPPAVSPTSPAGSNDGSPPAAATRRILLAEDTADTARFLILVLRSRGHEVEHATDGLTALELYVAAERRGEPFDLVLTDVQMPRMDGLGLTRRLRASGWEGPVIALTAHASAEHRRDAMAAGCNDHVAKPLTPDRIERLVQQHTSARRRHAA